MAKGARSPKADSAHDAILRAAVRQARISGTKALRIEVVLEEAFSSSSSLYHHFGSRAGLIEAVEAALHSEFGHQEDLSFLEDGLAIATTEQFFEYVTFHLRRAVTDPTVRPRRQGRLSTVVAAFDSPQLKHDFARGQTSMLSAIEEVVQRAVDKGLVNPDLDVTAWVAVLHTLSLGRLVTEPSMPDDERWLATATPILLSALRLPEGREVAHGAQ